jgi:hypothetical protein
LTPNASLPVSPSAAARQSTFASAPVGRIAVALNALPPLPAYQQLHAPPLASPPAPPPAPSPPSPLPVPSLLSPSVVVEVAMMEKLTKAKGVQRPHDYRPQPPVAALLPRPPSPVRTAAERKQAATQWNLARRATEISPTNKWCNLCLQV